ncbi:pyrroloquinoline quinone precursor peptide PqqA [Aliterella atlantica]|uniref:Coenzyme PQQ synthesis protein A n=1 Tax=Aliterella atlantica CENA595 TaxID=1618023 RepID=A0A0D8ZSD7_9CYAN|nr:pyrroloquinoline quinone precursor peptide PqqA [Aliterella atlantica]KJH70146.1 hypothetical protein UH38_20020 [Aliterella atlantica CENA595]
MAQNTDKDTHKLEDQSNSLSPDSTPGKPSYRPPTGKPAMDWEQPDYDELDLCMEVTTYIQNWQ